MQIKKATEVVSSGVPTAVQLEAINAQAKAKLQAEQVYVFSLRLCDDQVDRDFERFDTAALPELAKLFVGKTGIMDHCWSAENQVARIFETQIVKEQGVSFIKAWAYIRRGGDNEELIADIEAGIKKEVSVGCAMGRCICSVCGSEYGTCGHRKGEHYDGQLCCGILPLPGSQADRPLHPVFTGSCSLQCLQYFLKFRQFKGCLDDDAIFGNKGHFTNIFFAF